MMGDLSDAEIEVVDAIHEERIVHGDLKPANFLYVQGKLKLIDFERIKGGKPFDIEQNWFNDLLDDIGQPK